MGGVRGGGANRKLGKGGREGGGRREKEYVFFMKRFYSVLFIKCFHPPLMKRENSKNEQLQEKLSQSL